MLLAIVTAGANAVASQSASIEHVGPGTRDFHDPTFNVTVAGPAADLRVAVTAPDGTTVTRRLSRGEMRGGSGTVPIELDYGNSVGPDELPVRDGTYRVQVTSLVGVTVDTDTFEAGDAAGGSLTAVPTTNDTLPWTDEPAVYTEPNAGDSEVGVTIENEGTFHAEMTVVIRVPDDRIVFEDIPVAPGERRGVVFRLADERVDSIRANTGGSVTVELYTAASRDDPVATTETTVPPRSA